MICRRLKMTQDDDGIKITYMKDGKELESPWELTREGYMSPREYALLRAQAVESYVHQSKALSTIDRSLSLVALGLVGYGFCMMYELISDYAGKLEEAVSDVTVGIDVHPEVFGSQGRAILDAHYRARGWVRYRLWLRDYENASRVYAVSGTVKALPSAAAKVHTWESIISRAAPDVVPPGEVARVHPVDRVTGLVLNNRRTYFGVVGGLALLPAVPVVGSILRGSMKDESG